jgi:helix-turn-helix protein
LIDGIVVESFEGDMVEVNGQRYQARQVKDRIYIKYGTVAVWVPIKKEMHIP